MSFLEGSVTFRRYKVEGLAPFQFDESILELLSKNIMDKAKVPMEKNGVRYGWCGGRHVSDITFSHEKNVIDDLMIWGLVAEAHKIPAEKMKAYYEIEIAAQLKECGFKTPTKKQKKIAKETAMERLQDEAKDGRFVRRQMVQVAWDKNTNELYIGSTSTAFHKRLLMLFHLTFQRRLTSMTPGTLAREYWDEEELLEVQPTKFVKDLHPDAASWDMGTSSLDFLGNEFFLWLWFQCADGVDTFTLSDNTELAVMFSKTLSLDCPRGERGKDVITAEGPTRLPEALRAIQGGKLPRKTGFILHRLDRQYELTLQAETFFVSGAKLPKASSGTDRNGQRQERVESLRELCSILDMLYAHFLSFRIDTERMDTVTWPEIADHIGQWLLYCGVEK